MIGRIKGSLLGKEATRALVDVQGVAYELEVPTTTMFRLPDRGGEVILHTHLVVREDAHLLYGFHALRERELFRVLIRVNGVGPKMALAILSGLSTEELIRCVGDDDVNTLVRLPGVGRKTAERLIIELRDKLMDWEPAGETPGRTSAAKPAGASQQEAETALISLGYKPQEAARAVVQAAGQLEADGREADTEALIRLALKNMTRKS